MKLKRIVKAVAKAAFGTISELAGCILLWHVLIALMAILSAFITKTNPLDAVDLWLSTVHYIAISPEVIWWVGIMLGSWFLGGTVGTAWAELRRQPQ